MDFFTELNHWTWWVLGLLLLVLEMFAPAAVFMWMGLAALVTGFVLFVIPDMIWELQLVMFSLLSVISIITWKRLFGKRMNVSDEPLLNRRAQQYVDRVFTLDQPIVNGVGMVKVDDSSWRITGPELPAGARIIVVGEDGMSLRVDKLQ